MASYQPPPTYADVILVDPENKKPAKFNPIWLNWFLGLTQKLTPGGAGSGTVTDVSVITANGLAGSVANSATTPAITLSTTITGLLKGNGTAISAASSGTDYAPPTSGTSILYGNGSGGFSNVTIGTGVSFAAGTLSATGSGGTVTSVTGTAPVASSGGATPAISLNAGYGDTLNPYAAKTANYVLAGPTAGASAVPAFRALVVADIPSLTGTYVPYTGATADVDLDTFMLNAKAFHAKGTGGNGHLGLKHQSSTPSSTANESSIFADTNGNLGWLNGNKYLTTFSTSGNTANKTYTFPNTTGTVALTSDLTSYLTTVTSDAPLTGSGTSGSHLSIPAATTSVSGYLTSTDWTTFNNKGSGTVTSVSGTAGRVSSTGGTTPVIDLVSGIASAGTTGSASLIPVVTIDTYGRVTSITTAANPQGTVTSVAQSFTGGLISVAGSPITTSGTLALTVAGTSGGIPYFSSASTWATSAALTASALVVGGGAGAAPATITTGTGVVTALGVNTGTAGAFVVNGGALGTPSSGTVTNLTGTASINTNGAHNGTVGATTANTGAFTTLTSSSDATLHGITVGLGSGSVVGNTAVGYQAAFSNTTGSGVTAVGYQAAFSFATSSYITAVGILAGYTSTVSLTAVGGLALRYNTTGVGNVAVGGYDVGTGGYYAALYSNTTGNANTAVGNAALTSNTTGSQNSAFGWGSLISNGTGGFNTACGNSALYSNSTGSYNVAVGGGGWNVAFGALGSNTTGNNNAALGYQALFSNTTASNNTAVGYQAGYLSTGAGNQCFGYSSGSAVTSGAKNVILGSYTGSAAPISATGSNYVVLSDGDANIVASTKTAQTFALQGGTLSAGTGIAFPATQSASTDVNTLDDYEEGTWTPSQGAGLTVVGAFSSSGTYTKIGRQVTVIGYVAGATSVTVTSGGILCSGVPFSAFDYCLGTATDNSANNGISLYISATTILAANAIASATMRINFGATFFV
jgi:hypothetical protein